MYVPLVVGRTGWAPAGSSSSRDLNSQNRRNQGNNTRHGRTDKASAYSQLALVQCLRLFCPIAFLSFSSGANGPGCMFNFAFSLLLPAGGVASPRPSSHVIVVFFDPASGLLPESVT